MVSHTALSVADMAGRLTSMASTSANASGASISASRAVLSASEMASKAVWHDCDSACLPSPSDVDVWGTVAGLTDAITNVVDATVRNLAMVSLEAIDDNDHSRGVRQQTWGVFGHRFVVATFRNLNGKHTYLRIDFMSKGPSDDPVEIMLSHDRSVLVPNPTNAVMSLSSDDVALAPTLSDFSSLLVAIQTKGSSYDLFRRNCIWHAERILFLMAKRYADHWRRGEIRPDEFKNYVEGRMDAIDAAIAVGLPPGAGRTVGQAFLRVFKGAGSFFTSWLPANDPARIEDPNAEIEELMKEWVARG